MRREEILKATDNSSLLHGSQVESGPTTPLPDKKLLVFILDMLQKKDTRGVFSEPVDPEELPDYQEIIQNPMDFGTVRTKLDQGAYSNLEQFEKDVFLICSNAMEYNAPDTIYFRQARSIQELAKKDFENLRQVNEDGDPKPKIGRRGRPPGKSMKKSIEGSPLDHVGPQFVLETTLASGGENPSLSGTYNLRRPAPHKFRTSDALNMGPHVSLSGETGASWLPGWENECPASVLRSDLKYGKKHFTVDENRRDTYTQALAFGDELSMFSGCEGEWKQLVAVGLQFEHGYARSLARFAANLGPVGWNVASKKIASVLPVGIKFGPGWIGENETWRMQPFSVREKEQRVQSNPASDDHTNKLVPQSTLCSDEARLSEISSGPRCSHVLGGEASWNGSSLHNKHVAYTFPSGLNVKLGAAGSPQMGLHQAPTTAYALPVNASTNCSSNHLCYLRRNDLPHRQPPYHYRTRRYFADDEDATETVGPGGCLHGETGFVR